MELISVANLKALSMVSAGAALITWGMGETATAKTFKPAPLFKDVSSYTITISGNNDPTDIYFPKPSNLKTGKYSFPVALLLQGANVDKSNYSRFARIVASYGFVVVVPNHRKLVPQLGVSGLFAETSQLGDVLAQMVAENANPDSPIAKVVNTKKLALLGHSLGGVAGLSAIANLCIPTVCRGSFQQPAELVAGAFFGANLRDSSDKFIPINNSKIPTALLQGDLDSRALPLRAQATYDHIQNPPKALVTILGANHYGITNINNTVGSIPDYSNPTLAQDVAVETVARWSGLFLRASILNDQRAFKYVYSTGDALDQNVTVISQQTQPVTKAAWGLAVLGASGVVLSWKLRRFVG